MLDEAGSECCLLFLFLSFSLQIFGGSRHVAFSHGSSRRSVPSAVSTPAATMTPILATACPRPDRIKIRLDRAAPSTMAMPRRRQVDINTLRRPAWSPTTMTVSSQPYGVPHRPSWHDRRVGSLPCFAPAWVPSCITLRLRLPRPTLPASLASMLASPTRFLTQIMRQHAPFFLDQR